MIYAYLSQMLSSIGIKDKALKLLENYLLYRNQSVVVDGVNGKTLGIACGTPQGGVLSSFLFIIYINQIFYLPLQGSLQCGADDTCITNSSMTFLDLKSAMMKDLIIVKDFLFTHMNLANIFNSIDINNQIIHAVKEYKYLGLINRENLKIITC